MQIQTVRRIRFSGLLALATIAMCIPATPVLGQAKDLASPDGRLSVTAEVAGGRCVYRLKRDGKTLVRTSGLGLEIKGVAAAGWREVGRSRRSGDSTWKPVWGKCSEVRDHYNEMVLSLAASAPGAPALDVVFRAYDDGMAVRYVLRAAAKTPKTLRITGDLTEYNFAGDYAAWFYNGERANISETLAASKGRRRLPATIKVSDSCTLAIHEAALEKFGWMELTGKAGAPSFKTLIRATDVSLPFASPWRVIMAGDRPGRLVDSNLLENLNPPCAIKDPSWIKPGVSFWDWRAAGHKAGAFTYDLSMPSWKRFVDLAAESGVSYVLLDADWYGPEFNAKSDPTSTEKSVPSLIKYARGKGVGVFLYLNDVGATKYGLERVLRSFSQWGAAGVKYGFMRKPPGRPKVDWTRKVIALCATYKLMCDFHDGPVPPTGDYRTWPNCLTREYCHAQSDAKKAFTPTTFTTAVFVNGLAGPLDMNNGMLDLNHSKRQRPKVFAEIPSTITAEAARTLIVFSGLTVVPDSADSYRKHPRLFEFIAAQKMPWTQSRTLAGEIGQYIVTMRRTGTTVLVAAATNEQARTLTVPLDFLGKGSYRAVICADAPDAHYLKNREAYRTREQVVTAAETIKIVMAPGGGCCIRLVPQP